MTPQELKYSILHNTFCGKLSEQIAGEQVDAKCGFDIEEAPFDVPANWKWQHLGKCCEMYTGNSIAESEKKLKYEGLKEGFDYIGTKDVSFEHVIDYDNGVRIPFENDFRRAYSGSILMCIEGGSAGRKIAILDREVCFGNKLCMFKAETVLNTYLYYYLQSNEFKDSFFGNITGIIGGVSIKKLKGIVIPIPPLAEQKRIVAKIEELLPLIDHYEEAWTKLEDFNKRFPGDMQKSLLQLAIQGKLVEQCPEEGSGEELYTQIQAEKQALIKSGKIKKDNPLPEITDDEKPFDIPEGWKWVRLGEILTSTDAGKSPQCEDRSRSGNEWGVIKTTAIQNGFFLPEENKVLPEKFAVQEGHIVHCGDLLITRAGPRNRTGVLCVVSDEPTNLILSDKTVRLSYIKGLVEPLFIMYMLNSPAGQVSIIGAMTGMAASQVNISQDSMKKFLLPLPPLAEQKRIVAKLEELLPLCEGLK